MWPTCIHPLKYTFESPCPGHAYQVWLKLAQNIWRMPKMWKVNRQATNFNWGFFDSGELTRKSLILAYLSGILLCSSCDGFDFLLLKNQNNLYTIISLIMGLWYSRAMNAKHHHRHCFQLFIYRDHTGFIPTISEFRIRNFISWLCFILNSPLSLLYLFKALSMKETIFLFLLSNIIITSNVGWLSVFARVTWQVLFCW